MVRVFFTELPGISVVGDALAGLVDELCFVTPLFNTVKDKNSDDIEDDKR